MQESRSITRKSASNLALAFVLLPRPKRDAMSALYAFCREVDDIADEEQVPVAERREKLAAWREDVRRAFAGETAQFTVNRELQQFIRRHRLPYEHFEALLKGVEMDLEISRYQDFEELEAYCYRVASAVGLLSIEVFGYQDPGTKEYAVSLGKALQLTNILRDVRVDALRGRIYLPLSELARFRVEPEEVLKLEYTSRFADLAASIADRAGDCYRQAVKLLPAVDRRSMIAAEVMGAVYWRLLEKLRRQRFRVFEPRVIRLSKPHKGLLILRTWLRALAGSNTPNYGA